jgi:hypothetical protein
VISYIRTDEDQVREVVEGPIGREVVSEGGEVEEVGKEIVGEIKGEIVGETIGETTPEVTRATII